MFRGKTNSSFLLWNSRIIFYTNVKHEKFRLIEDNEILESNDLVFTSLYMYFNIYILFVSDKVGAIYMQHSHSLSVEVSGMRLFHTLTFWQFYYIQLIFQPLFPQYICMYIY